MLNVNYRIFDRNICNYGKILLCIFLFEDTVVINVFYIINSKLRQGEVVFELIYGKQLTQLYK
ncbi:hypothetical protein GCM10007199_29570 [Fictibacillus barbaricus]|nr:hypothetical protein GCM10007199_29570 [Fictibacillus barbaricus]